MTLVKDEKDAKNAKKEVETLHKVAVYGSLRKGLGNHSVLGAGKLLGTFESQPNFTMYSVGGWYPGLVEEGTTSVIMEVYEVNDEDFKAVNHLEGFYIEDDPSNHYNRKLMTTPFGEAYHYIYNMPTAGLKIVESGDWKKFKELSDFANNIKAQC